MKSLKTFFFLLCLIAAAMVNAQAPQAINSQAVLRDALGRLIANQPVSVRITIAQGSPTGTAAYMETHTVTTNDKGLYTITIGAGTPATGTFSTIDWGNGPYFITTDIDPAGGTNYTITTSQHFISVPYALFADTAARVAQAAAALTATTAQHADSTDIAQHANAADTAIYVDTALYYQEQQVLSRSGDTICLTGGSYVVLPLSNCYATCSAFDSLRQRVNSVRRVNDSVFRRLSQRIDSVSAANTPFCVGRNTSGTDVQSACETYTWIDGNTYTSSTTTPTYTLVGGNAAGCDSTVTLHLTITGMEGCSCSGTVAVDGVLPGEFSVSPTKKVKFSQGNLQYKASTNTWRFAKCQYQYVGQANENISATYDCWIDLFGWGTSGYHDPADEYNTRYMPYESFASTVNTNYNLYGYGPSTNQASPNLTGSSAHYDWGVHNAISNGGNAAGMWRTLTSSEWVYLMETRTTTGMVGGTANARYCKATVDGVEGLIIFPDSYVHPAGVPASSHTNQSSADFSDTFTASQWGSMETAGCVFLPAAGDRNVAAGHNAGPYGGYWSSTYCGDDRAYNPSFSSNHMYPQYGRGELRSFGLSVRLVQDLCIGQNTSGIDNQTACESFTWIDGNTYTSSTTTPTFTIVGGNAVGCDSTVTLQLTINHGTHNVETQSAIVSYTWHDSTYISTGDYVYTYTNDSGCASVDTLHLTIQSVTIINGALPGEFSVSSTQKVKFSQGNLQYQASTNTWRFAEHQYNYVGGATNGNVYVGSTKSNNANISATYDGWIDLFGWGTSGYHDPADAYNTRYMPYDTATSMVNMDYNYYGYGPSRNQTSPNLTGSSAHYDWGVHNAISNGGNMAGMWRTLTKNEWVYLMKTRATSSVVGGTANARYCKATVSGIYGVILFPDNYVHPTGIPVPSHTNQDLADYSDIFTSTQWASMEAAGCVFLPAAGSREGAIIDENVCGDYWSSDYFSNNGTYCLHVHRANTLPQFATNRHYGISVRLVQNASDPCLGHTTTGTDNQTACETYTWINGNTYTSSTTTPTFTIVGGNAAGCDSTVTLHLTITGMDGCSCSGTVAVDGVLPGEFSVSATKKVKFSQGNLQYRASTNTWRFAECQCQYVGQANENASSTYDGWIDLFGWGTSGYHDPSDTYNTRYMPYETGNSNVNSTYNYYGYGPSTNMVSRNLIGSSAHYDWGVHNPISNGGNTAGMWRTLTSDEWKYLINTRATSSVVGSTANARYCKATVSGINGVILFPDSYVHPIGIPIPSHTNQSSADYSDVFTSTQWASMETAGCVFLPTAGLRDGGTFSGSYGRYWSTTYNNSSLAKFLNYDASTLDPQYSSNRNFGRSVRLVKDL